MTKEQDFKTRFIQILKDLQVSGTKDQEAMYLLGSLAADLAGNMGAATWSGAKANMTAQAYDALLKTCESEGNAHHAAGRTKHAYAVQALAVSLIARTQHADPHLQAGDKLLDGIIDLSIALYRNQLQPTIN